MSVKVVPDALTARVISSLQVSGLAVQSPYLGDRISGQTSPSRFVVAQHTSGLVESFDAAQRSDFGVAPASEFLHTAVQAVQCHGAFVEEFAALADPKQAASWSGSAHRGVRRSGSRAAIPRRVDPAGFGASAPFASGCRCHPEGDLDHSHTSGEQLHSRRVAVVTGPFDGYQCHPGGLNPLDQIFTALGCAGYLFVLQRRLGSADETPNEVSLWESIPIMAIALPFVAILHHWQNGSAIRKHTLRHHHNGLRPPTAKRHAWIERHRRAVTGREGTHRRSHHHKQGKST